MDAMADESDDTPTNTPRKKRRFNNPMTLSQNTPQKKRRFINPMTLPQTPLAKN